MSFGNEPRDAGQIPISSIYIPGVGFVALQGSLSSTDGLGNASAPVSTCPPLSSTAALSSVSASTSTTSILSANGSRKAAYIYNDSASAMYLALGTSVSTTLFSFKIPASSLFEMPTAPIWQGALAAVWDTATGNARVTEVS